MGVIEVGKTYLLAKGRRAGQAATVTKIVDEKIVMVKTEKGKERKASVGHLLPAGERK